MCHPHVDLSHTITTLWLRSRITLTVTYVLGHQDALTWLEDLSPLACLNIWADTLAKKELH